MEHWDCGFHTSVDLLKKEFMEAFINQFGYLAIGALVLSLIHI